MTQEPLSLDSTDLTIQKAVALLASPLLWWFTPRATDQDEAFRECCLRWLLPLNIVFHSFLFYGELAASHSISFTTQILFVMVAAASLSAIIFILRKHVDLAGYSIAIQAIISFVLDQTLEYWSPLAFGRTAITMLFFALILPKNRYLVALIALQFAAYVAHMALPVGSSPLAATEPYSSPATAFVASTITLVAGGGVVYFLLKQYARQRDELKALVATLGDRVRERTHELEHSKNEAVEARIKAEEANRIKSQFLASMSHELRTPLNAILNFTEMMALGLIGDVTDKQKEVLNKSLNSSKHLLSLINDVLDISKMQAGMLSLFIEEKINLNDELDTVSATVEPLFRSSRAQFVRDIDKDLPLISGDKRRIRQVLLNLVSNAAKFTEIGTVTLSAKRRSDSVLFAVLDTGPGIAKEEQAVIFQPLVQTDTGIRHANGTGLGLAITRHTCCRDELSRDWLIPLSHSRCPVAQEPL